MTILEEGSGTKKLCFEFSNQWRVCNYDDDLESFYRQNIQKCQGIGAVDFIATNGENLLWIEVKNFCGFASETQPYLLSEEPQAVINCRETGKSLKQQIKVTRRKPFLADLVAQKIRDTFFGFAVALHQDDTHLKPFIDDFKRGVPITIVLFLHQDKELDNPEKFKDMAPKLKTRIEQKLRCLNVNVLVENSLTLPEDAGWKLKSCPSENSI